jgi:GT2 family glycosyltransferase
VLDSVIVTFHQNGALLRLCLERLERAMPASAELIVVMNNADVRELAVPLPGRARVLEVPCNLGYAAAANLGAREARGRRLTFVDHDIVVAPGWFEALAELHESIAGPTLTGCKICDPQTLRVLDFGIGFTPFNAPHPHMDQPQHSALVAQNRQVQALCTAVCMIDRSTFEDLGVLPLVEN